MSIPPEAARFLEAGVFGAAGIIGYSIGFRGRNIEKEVIARTATFGAIFLGIIALLQALGDSFMIRGDGAEVFTLRYFGFAVSAAAFVMATVIALKSRSLFVYGATWLTFWAGIALWRGSFTQSDTIRTTLFVVAFVTVIVVLAILFAHGMKYKKMNTDGTTAQNWFAWFVRFWVLGYLVLWLVAYAIGQPGYLAVSLVATEWIFVTIDIVFLVPLLMILIHANPPKGSVVMSAYQEDNVGAQKRDEEAAVVENAGKSIVDQSTEKSALIAPDTAVSRKTGSLAFSPLTSYNVS